MDEPCRRAPEQDADGAPVAMPTHHGERRFLVLDLGHDAVDDVPVQELGASAGADGRGVLEQPPGVALDLPDDYCAAVRRVRQRKLDDGDDRERPDWDTAAAACCMAMRAPAESSMQQTTRSKTSMRVSVVAISPSSSDTG